jgi:hypothetical protein
VCELGRLVYAAAKQTSEQEPEKKHSSSKMRTKQILNHADIVQRNIWKQIDIQEIFLADYR